MRAGAVRMLAIPGPADSGTDAVGIATETVANASTSLTHIVEVIIYNYWLE
jgi:hypothetical protein